MIIDTGKAWNEQTTQVLSPPPWYGANETFSALSWSPDGKYLAGIASGICIYSLESRAYERLTDFGGVPMWLSDSRRLLFASNGKLSLLDIQSKKWHEILAIAGEVLASPRVSKDNRQITFTSARREADIWLATLKR